MSFIAIKFIIKDISWNYENKFFKVYYKKFLLLQKDYKKINISKSILNNCTHIITMLNVNKYKILAKRILLSHKNYVVSHIC